ncbi:hypothetical protein BDV18DRAFT_162279 [Aspergillus unguis]
MAPPPLLHPPPSALGKKRQPQHPNATYATHETAEAECADARNVSGRLVIETALQIRDARMPIPAGISASILAAQKNTKKSGGRVLDSVPNQSEDQRNIATSDDNNVLSQVEERPECPLSHPPPPSVTASDDNLALPIDQSPQAMYSDDIDERLDGAEHLVAYCVHAWAEYDAGQRGVLTPPNLHRYAFSVARAGREIWEQENGTNTDGCEDDQGPNGESQYDIRTEINAQGNGACRSGYCMLSLSL